MAWRLADSVLRGEIDNRDRGRVTGRIWLLNRDDPVELNLRGNCLRDIAGSLIVFHNPSPKTGDLLDLDGVQTGVVGDVTASRKVRVFEVSLEEAQKLQEAGKPIPEHISNSLYLEWYSENDGRVVVESTEFAIEVSQAVWRMSAREERAQLRRNMEAIEDWMDHLREEDEYWDEDEEFDDGECAASRTLDEFQWEKRLRESDALGRKYSALLKDLIDHPERDRIIAREMGWDWVDEALHGEERGETLRKTSLHPEDTVPLEPNPLTEGRDWVRTATGRVTHPLSQRAHAVALDMWQHCSELGLMGESGDKHLQDMIFQAQCLSAKLAGALNGIAYGHDVEGGFVVACLKRTLVYINRSLSSADTVANRELVVPERLADFRANLFAIRQEILQIMKHYRRGR
jgi:hypothetical protein